MWTFQIVKNEAPNHAFTPNNYFNNDANGQKTYFQH